MEFTEYKCPICDKQFKKGDDVVVCPECGAPHHRECYEKEGHCHFADKHGADFSFEKEQLEEAEQQAEQDAKDGVVLCKRCGAENPKEMFYCCNCGAPLYGDDKTIRTFGRIRITVSQTRISIRIRVCRRSVFLLVRQIRKWLPLLILWQE